MRQPPQRGSSQAYEGDAWDHPYAAPRFHLKQPSKAKNELEALGEHGPGETGFGASTFL